MTTKKFQVRTNLKGLEDVTFTSDNRADAIAYITNTLMGNSQINPQDLILEEVEIEEKSELEMIADKVAKHLLLFAEDKPIITLREVTPTGDKPFMLATITRPQAHYLPLTGATIKAMVKILDGWDWWIATAGNIEISQDIND